MEPDGRCSTSNIIEDRNSWNNNDVQSLARRDIFFIMFLPILSLPCRYISIKLLNKFRICNQATCEAVLGLEVYLYLFGFIAPRLSLGRCVFLVQGFISLGCVLLSATALCIGAYNLLSPPFHVHRRD